MSFVLKQDIGNGVEVSASTKDAQFSLVKRIRLAVWRHSYGDDNLVMRKAAITLMPAFPP